MSVSTTIHIGTVEREAVGSASNGVEQDFGSSLMSYGVKGALYNGTLARRLNKYAASSFASGFGTTS